MSLATLEKAILEELRVVAKRPDLKKKDIQEWSTGEIKPHEGETLYRLPEIGAYVAVKLPPEKKKRAPKAQVPAEGPTVPPHE